MNRPDTLEGYSCPVFIVSLGPGDPELITLKALHAMQRANRIFCPETPVAQEAGGGTASRAADILRQLGIPMEAVRLFRLPMSRERGAALAAYRSVAEEVAGLWREGKRVCVVAEGDAGFYSSVHYIADRLASLGIPLSCLPGIPAFIAAGAAVGMHIARGSEPLTILPGNATCGGREMEAGNGREAEVGKGTDRGTGREDREIGKGTEAEVENRIEAEGTAWEHSPWTDLESLVEAGGTVVIMKPSRCRDALLCCLSLHPEYRWHYLQDIGTPQQRLLQDPREIAALRFPYFSLMIVRKGE